MERDEAGVQVRDARIGDLSVVAQMAKELAATVEDPAPRIDADSLQTMVFGEERWCECLVAVEDEMPVGYAISNRYFEPHTGSRRLILADLYVRTTHRRRGTGQRLFAAVLDRARALNCAEVSWEIWDRNTAAVAFYERLGARRADDICLMHFSVK